MEPDRVDENEQANPGVRQQSSNLFSPELPGERQQSPNLFSPERPGERQQSPNLVSSALNNDYPYDRLSQKYKVARTEKISPTLNSV